MSNRQERRRRHIEIDGPTTRIATSQGVVLKVDGDQLNRILTNPMTAPPGVHLWVATAAWRVNPAEFLKGEAHLDLENMLTIGGPGCFICEREYGTEMALQPCPGEPS